MPYIKDKDLRKDLDNIANDFIKTKNIVIKGDYDIKTITNYFSKIGIKGNLNYYIFKIARLKPTRNMSIKLRFELFWIANDLCHSYGEWSRFIAECECSKREIIRRMGRWKTFWIGRYLNKTINDIYNKQLVPHEDNAIKKNGDVK